MLPPFPPCFIELLSVLQAQAVLLWRLRYKITIDVISIKDTLRHYQPKMLHSLLLRNGSVTRHARHNIARALLPCGILS